ncbi:hypothetical protein SRHO_G00032330 [Serrasalmus rhombeus]
MLLKVKSQGTKKCIRLHSGFTCLGFISEVASELHICDESDTAVEEDILLELMEANPDLCLTVRDDQSASSSLTDTRSPSSDNELFSRHSRDRPVHHFRDGNPPTTVFSEAEAAKELNQDFVLLFGEETSSRLLERWDTTFKPKVIEESKHLTKSTELHRLLNAAEKHAEDDDTSNHAAALMNIWVNNLTSLLLARLRRESTHSTSLWTSSSSLAKPRSLGAFDELFKSHYMFSLSHDESLVHFYTFVQTTVYSIDITTTDESPRVREFRAKLFN